MVRSGANQPRFGNFMKFAWTVAVFFWPCKNNCNFATNCSIVFFLLRAEAVSKPWFRVWSRSFPNRYSLAIYFYPHIWTSPMVCGCFVDGCSGFYYGCLLRSYRFFYCCFFYKFITKVYFFYFKSFCNWRKFIFW